MSSMSLFTAVDTATLLGRDPDSLTFAERSALAWHWIALQIYTPQNLAPRRIEGIGDSPEECARQLVARGLAPSGFEFIRVTPPY